MLRFLANLLWLILGGLILGLLWTVLGILLCITIVGFPLGAQCFKMARLSFAPYGKSVDLNVQKHPIANTLWAILAGWEMALIYLLFGILNCLTVIGLSTGLQCFKFMKLALFPFGAKIKKK